MQLQIGPLLRVSRGHLCLLWEMNIHVVRFMSTIINHEHMVLSACDATIKGQTNTVERV